MTVLLKRAHQCHAQQKQYFPHSRGNVLVDMMYDHIYFFMVILHWWLCYPLTEEDTANSLSFLVSPIMSVPDSRNFSLKHDFSLCTIKSHSIPITLVFKVMQVTMIFPVFLSYREYCLNLHHQHISI